MNWKTALLVVIIVGMVLVFTPPSQAQEPSASYTIEEVLTGFVAPIDYIELPNDSGDFLLVQQSGMIYLIEDGVARSEPFIDLRGRVFYPEGYTEQGLLGIALDPEFSENGYFYLNYTARDPQGTTYVSRFNLLEGGELRGDPESEAVILTVDQPYANHNGGMIDFGPDGYLYISLGDGGSAGDPQNNGQNPRTLLGTVLRLDVRSAFPYTIPEDNPFVDGADGAPEIWAYGLRNVWRFSFDIETGDLYLADVGQNEYEEVNFQAADSPGGQNYGWNVFEGTHLYRASGIEGTVMPIAEYNHIDGCSITGGYVYRGETMPELDGYYLYGDYCSGRVWWLTRDESGEWQNGLIFDTDMQISSFGQDRSGEIYILDYRGGIYRIIPE